MSSVEVLVVDDGSTDGTGALVLGVCATDARFRLLTKSNGGVSTARNLGLDNARGRFIAFLDADDYWHPEKLEKHLKHLECRPSVAVSYCATQFVDVGGNLLHVRVPQLRNVEDYYLYCRNPLTNGSVGVFRREIFKIHRFDETKARNNDVDCWLRIAFTEPGKWLFEGIPEALTYYRVTPSSLSTAAEAHLDACRHTWAKSRVYAPAVAARYAGLAEAFQFRFYARRAVADCDMPAARRYIVSALKSSPAVLFREGMVTLQTLMASLLPGSIARLLIRIRTRYLSQPGLP
jgi:glycosyltransferase involved in cell wall biosynthesis